MRFVELVGLYIELYFQCTRIPQFKRVFIDSKGHLSIFQVFISIASCEAKVSIQRFMV